MSEKKSSDEYGSKRLPPSYRGIQVNYCKSPVCKNFGVLPKQGIRGAGKGKRKLLDPNYRLTGGGKNNSSVQTFKCKACNEFPPVKSNRGIYIEYKRLSKYLDVVERSCSNTNCINHKVGLKSHPDKYQKFGRSRHGAPRYRCKSCKKTFSIGKSTRKHRAPHKNIEVFKLFINKMPINRIAEVTGLTYPSVYGKIDFIHKQCLAFIANRERKIVGEHFADRLYLSTDRQMYYLNWTRRKDKRTINFEAVGTADNNSSYVFGMHLNFDPNLNAEKIEGWAERCNDYSRPIAMRRHAHLWLINDYLKSAINNSGVTHPKDPPKQPVDPISLQYSKLTDREDIESADFMTEDVQLPLNGMQIHNEYTLYAHFLLMSKMFEKVGKVRFYMDFESGIRAAFMVAFNQRILDRTADAWYVSINKDLNVHERAHHYNKAQRIIAQFKQEYPKLSDQEIRIEILKQAIDRIKHLGPWKDRWVQNPLSTMSEAEKKICWLTDLGDYSKEHQAALYNKASLHAIDRFFMQARRRFTYIERPIASASGNRRMWYGYTPYNPFRLQQALEIYRTVYNYCFVGKDKQTPAMRLGLAKGKVELEDIIYFQ